MTNIYHIFSLLLLAILLLTTPLPAQHRIATGGMTAETAIASTADRVFVAWQDEGERELPENVNPNAIYRAIDLPLGATELFFDNDHMTGKLAAVGLDGSLLWERTYGGSRASLPFAITGDGAGGLFVAARAPGTTDSLVVERLDSSGRVIWQTYLDSLESASGIFHEPTTGDLGILAWTESAGVVPINDSIYEYRTTYVATSVRLDATNGRPTRLGRLPHRTIEEYFSELRTSSGIIPEMISPVEWTLAGPGIAPGVQFRDSEGPGIVRMHPPPKMADVPVSTLKFRDGAIAMTGRRPESNDLVLGCSWFAAGEVRSEVRTIDRHGSQAKPWLFFNDHGSVSLAISDATVLRMLVFDSTLSILSDTRSLPAGRRDARLAAVVPSVKTGAWDVVFVSQKAIGVQREIWWRRIAAP